MTKSDNLALYSALIDKRLGSLPGIKFAYAVSRNISLLKPEIEALEKALEPSDEYKKYDEKRIELAKKYSKKGEKGEKGEPLTMPNPENPKLFEYVLEDKEGFQKDFEALKEENKEIIEKRNAQIKEQDDFLKTDSTIELFKVSVSEVPQNITVAQMNSIYPIVTDDIISPLNSTL